MEIEGKIKVIGDTKEYGRNGFQKRMVVITTEEKYPQDLAVDFVQDKTNLVDGYNVGDKVKVGINLRGREWVSPQGETKYFNSINAWRIEKLTDSTASNDVPPIDENIEPIDKFNEEDGDEGSGGLPF